MPDLASEVVMAIASGAGNSLGAKGVSAIEHLLKALRTKFHGQPQARSTLENAAETPADPAALDSLAALLGGRITRDPEFAAWLANLWAEVQPAFHADASKAANVISGTVHGNVVQARDIHGGIHLSDDA